MAKAIALLVVAGVCVGCAAPVERARDRLKPVIREAIQETKDYEDTKLDTWRDLVKLTEQFACGLSVGARQRATDDERQSIDAVDCRRP